MTFTKDDKEKFNQLKNTVKSGEIHAMAWGKALVEIDRHEYWRMDNTSSMHDWAEQHCPLAYLSIQNAMRRLGRTQAQQLIKDTTGERIISDSKSRRDNKKLVPPMETPYENKVRSCVPEELRPAVAQHITAAHKNHKPEDYMGAIIPTPILEIWNRRAEIEELMAAVSKVKCLIAHKRAEEDPLFMKIDQSAIGRLEQLHYMFASAMPYTVCGVCEGRLEILKDNICGACKSTGFMSKDEYNRLVPEEKQNIRKKGIELRKAGKK